MDIYQTIDDLVPAMEDLHSDALNNVIKLLEQVLSKTKELLSASNPETAKLNNGQQPKVDNDFIYQPNALEPDLLVKVKEEIKQLSYLS